MTIIISKNGKNAKKVDKSSFEQEDYLQEYIYANPDSIPLYDIKEDIRLLIIAREFETTNSGRIDALGIDKDGEIYLVETKLYKNPDKRLVVAQVLDYGSSLWHGYRDFGEFLRVIDEEINRKFGISFNQRLKEFFGIGDEEVSGLIETVKSNLNNGNFKFVVLMDKLHDQLKDLIRFINQNSQFSIFAVEMEYYKHEDYEIMIPKLFGAEVKKDVRSSAPGIRKKWNEPSFFADATRRVSEKTLTDEQYKAIEALYNFSKRKVEENIGQISWGTGAERGSFNVKFSKISVRSLYSVYSDGTLSLNFGWLNDIEDAEKYRDEFKNKLSRIKAITIPPDYQEKYVTVPADKWGPIVNDFIGIVQDLINE